MDLTIKSTSVNGITETKLLGSIAVDRFLYPPEKPIAIGRVITTFGSAPWVHLQLETHKRSDPNIPALVFDDCSPDQDALVGLCKGYGVAYQVVNTRLGHILGDMCGIWTGLEWADGKFDILLKTSRRWVVTKPWAESLTDLARTTQAATFSGYAKDIGFGFRTECFAMHVPSWRTAREHIKGRVLARDQQFVESYCHGFTNDMYHNRCEEARLFGDKRPIEYPGSQTYAVWKDMLGTAKHVRQDVPLGVLWGGGWHTFAEISEYAKSIGLDYNADDFNIGIRAE